MRKNFQRLVWVILIGAFATFCMLAIGIPLAVRSHLFNAIVPLPATLEAISGTVLVQIPGDPEPAAVSIANTASQNVPRFRDLPVGAIITTDNTSRAILTFHRPGETEDVVLSTVQLYNNTRVRILEGRSPRYAISPHPDRLALAVDAGQVRFAATHSEPRELSVEIATPQGNAFVQEGSYSVRVAGDQTMVIVRFGEATVEAGSRAVTVLSAQRTIIPTGEVPQLPLPAAQNLIVNGNFTDPLQPAWQTDSFEAAAGAGAGNAEIVTTGDRKAVFLSRMGKDGVHAEVGFSQVINRDVLDFESLVLRLDVKLMYQSLSGGGYLSSEFPIMIRIDYKDSYGIDRFWTHGFYYDNPDGHPILNDTWGRPIGEQIPHAIWYPYESENLVKALGDIRPARIHSIRIYASGWNFQSMVSEVGLIAE
jgi:hypothetical protein